jgi:hypothetical protein
MTVHTCSYSATNRFFIVLCCSLFALSSGKVYRGFNDIAPMPISVSDMTATIVDKTEFQDQLGARVYVIGGCSGIQLCPPGEFCYCTEVTNSCNIFFIKTQTWESCPSMPLVARSRHSAVYLDGKIYLFGGRDLSDSLVHEVEIFDVASGIWLESLTWANATSDGGAFTDETSVYLIGGYDANYAPLATLTQFTPTATLPWNTDLPAMTYARGDIGVIAVPKEKNNLKAGSNYFVVGGFADDICVPLSVVETYEPATKTWTTRTSVNDRRADLALGVLQGFLFAIAGETKDETCNSTSYLPGRSIPVKDVERLEKINAVKWNYEEDIPDKRFRFVAASHQDAIYLFGGQGDLVEPVGGTPFYPVLNTTMLYVPKSIADQKELNDGEIAGIVIGCVAFAILVVVLALAYIASRKYGGYLKSAEGEEEERSRPSKGRPANGVEGIEISYA